MHIPKVREFRAADLDNIQENEYSNFESFKGLLGLEQLLKATLVEGEEVICIMAAIEYSDTKWKGFLLVSELMRARHGVFIKEVLEKFLTEHNVTRLETESVACKNIDRWHRFLGFELEGTKRKFIDNIDFNIWSITGGN